MSNVKLKILTQAMRDELRYELEDNGMPEVLAYMAAERADAAFYMGTSVIYPFLWDRTPEGYDFWYGVWKCYTENMAKQGRTPANH